MSTLRFDFLHLVKVVESQFLGLTRINTTLQQEHRGVLALTAMPAQHVPLWYPVFCESDQWLLRSGELNLGFFQIWQQKLCKITHKICEALRDTRIQRELPKTPPLRQIRKTKGFGAVYEGQFKSCGALITVHRTRYRSETDPNVTNKLC